MPPPDDVARLLDPRTRILGVLPELPRGLEDQPRATGCSVASPAGLAVRRTQRPGVGTRRSRDVVERRCHAHAAANLSLSCTGATGFDATCRRSIRSGGWHEHRVDVAEMSLYPFAC
jgi:hypothetical protein